MRPARDLPTVIYELDIIWIVYHIVAVGWVVEIGDEFEPEFDALHQEVQAEILACGPPAPAVRATGGAAPR